MAAAAVAVTSQPKSTSLTPVAWTWTAVDAVDGALIPYKVGDLVYVRNVSTDTPRTVTVTSTDDTDVDAESVAFGGAPYPLPVLEAKSFLDPDGTIHASGSSAEIEFAVIRPRALG